MLHTVYVPRGHCMFSVRRLSRPPLITAAATQRHRSQWVCLPIAASLSPGHSNHAAAHGTSSSRPPWLLQGAIYVTDNAGYSWTAAVKETVDATLNRTVSSGISGASYYEGTFANISRSKAGDYVAVSSRGWCRTEPLGLPCCYPAAITCLLPGLVAAQLQSPAFCLALALQFQQLYMAGTT